MTNTSAFLNMPVERIGGSYNGRRGIVIEENGTGRYRVHWRFGPTGNRINIKTWVNGRFLRLYNPTDNTSPAPGGPNTDTTHNS